MAVAPGELTLAAELHGGAVTATLQASDDHFQSIRAAPAIRIQDGVHTYRLQGEAQASSAVRLRLDFVRGTNASETPAIDGFRLIGRQAR
jgi:hypothetical protein